jgi:transposase-like protein
MFQSGWGGQSWPQPAFSRPPVTNLRFPHRTQNKPRPLFRRRNLNPAVLPSLPSMSSPVIEHHTTSALTTVQQQVIVALTHGASVSAAAQSAGVHRATIHRWLATQPAFEQAAQGARAEYIFTLRDQMRELSALALDTLYSLLTDTQAAAPVRLRAALAVLERPKFPQAAWSLPEQIGATNEEQLRKNLLMMELDSQGKLDQATVDRSQEDV